MSQPTLDLDLGQVVVDDQLALLAALGSFPLDLDQVPVTTYAWQQRVLGAFVAPTCDGGQLQKLAGMVGASAARAIASAGDPDPNYLVIADPRPLAVDFARLRVTGANSLAAELIAMAWSLDATVLLSTGNSHGHVADPRPSSPSRSGTSLLGRRDAAHKASIVSTSRRARLASADAPWLTQFPGPASATRPDRPTGRQGYVANPTRICCHITSPLNPRGRGRLIAGAEVLRTLTGG